jgi:hypothetical protein
VWRDAGEAGRALAELSETVRLAGVPGRAQQAVFSMPDAFAVTYLRPGTTAAAPPVPSPRQEAVPDTAALLAGAVDA